MFFSTSKDMLDVFLTERFDGEMGNENSYWE